MIKEVRETYTVYQYEARGRAYCPQCGYESGEQVAKDERKADAMTNLLSNFYLEHYLHSTKRGKNKEGRCWAELQIESSVKSIKPA
jgi:hypothetical protein